MKDTNNVINKASTIVLTVVLLFLPICIVPGDDYNYLRRIALLACGLLLFILFLVKIPKIKLHKEDILLIGFLILAIVSTIFSVNVKQSILGADKRYEGLLAIITYLLVYIHAKNCFEEYDKFENMTIGVYIFICLLSIVQFYLPNNIKLMPIFGKGANGTFGNVNFMGSFVSIILPIFIFKYITEGKKKYLICSIIAFATMMMCVTRSAWLAFTIYYIFILIYSILKKDESYKKRFLCTMIAFILCFTFVMITQGEKNILLNKLYNTNNEIQIMIDEGKITDRMGSGRITIWKWCAKILEKSPILGCGVDALNPGLVHFCSPEYIEFVMSMRRSIDKAHNEYLHIAATMGIPALITYIAFLCMVLLPNLKKCLRDEKSMLLVIVISSYLLQAFFNISTIGIAPIFWFILGIATKKAHEIEEK